MQSKSQLIKTYARIKPRFLGQQKMFFRKNICTIQSINNQDFQFDGVFDDDTNNEQIYKESSFNIIEQAFQGYNGCILAYGQTASGKTHTIKGNSDDPGIVPQALRHIFSKQKNQDFDFVVKVQYIEIYNEDIIDLLDLTQNKIIQIREDGKGNLMFPGITLKQITTFEQGMEFFQFGQKKRKFASNNVNSMSSRSHVIFRIDLSIAKEFQRRSSQINLVDLAGSQGVDQTKATKSLKSQGQNINKSLLALKKVLKQISQSQGKNYVNYRDSKLTRILKKSLCQNASSSIICTINPTNQNFHESINTLKFGLTAGKIKIQTRQNLIKSEQTSLKMQHQIFKQRFTDIPSRAQLEQQKSLILKLQHQNSSLENQRQTLQKQNYIKQNRINDLQIYVRQLQAQLNNQKVYNQHNGKSVQLKIHQLQNSLYYYKIQVQRLDNQIEKLRLKNKELQKNQKILLEQKQDISRQLRNVTIQMNRLKDQYNEQTNRSKKLTFSFRQQRQKQTKTNTKLQANTFKNQKNTLQQNPFYLAPYIAPQQRNSEPISHQTLPKITQLKTKVVYLGIQLGKRTKQYIELQEQHNQLKNILKRKQKEQQEQEQNRRSTGKINPAAIQFNQIRRLKNKIKKLQTDLKRSQKRQFIAKEKLKKINQDQLIEVEEFNQFFNRKNNKEFYVQREIQAFYSQKKNNYEQIKQIQIDQIKPQFSQFSSINQNTHFMNQPNYSSSKSNNSNMFRKSITKQQQNLYQAGNNPEYSSKNIFGENINSSSQKQRLFTQINNENQDFNVLRNQMNSFHRNNSQLAINNNCYNNQNQQNQLNSYGSPTKSQRNNGAYGINSESRNLSMKNNIFSKKIQQSDDQNLLSSYKQPPKNDQNQNSTYVQKQYQI